MAAMLLYTTSTLYVTPTSCAVCQNSGVGKSLWLPRPSFPPATPLFYKPQVSSSSAVHQNISVVQLIIVAMLFSICHAHFSTCHALLVKDVFAQHIVLLSFWHLVHHMSVTLNSYGCHAYAGHAPYLLLPHEKSLKIVTVIYISCRKIWSEV